MYHLGLDPERYPRHHHNQTGWDVGVEHKVSEQIDIKLHFTFLFKIKKKQSCKLGRWNMKYLKKLYCICAIWHFFIWN